MAEPDRLPPPGLPFILFLATIVVGAGSLVYLTGPTKESNALCLVAAALAFGLASIAIRK